MLLKLNILNKNNYIKKTLFLFLILLILHANNAINNVYWASNSKGQKLNMEDFFNIAGKNVSSEIFELYFNNMVDNQIATMIGMDLGYNTDKAIPD